MSQSIEYRRANGLAGSECFGDARQYQAAVRALLSEHAERGHVIESVHGQVEVRDREGVRIATYWFVD